jgi:exodeoxyribonuclease VII large subunit
LKRAVLARLARHQRQFAGLNQRLEASDLRRRLAVDSGRLKGADNRMRAAAARSRERADARLRVLVGRLETLSPLAVLARGYAVCWNADGTSIVRDAAQARPGDRVRVTLSRGELHCEVVEGSGRSPAEKK